MCGQALGLGQQRQQLGLRVGLLLLFLSRLLRGGRAASAAVRLALAASASIFAE